MDYVIEAKEEIHALDEVVCNYNQNGFEEVIQECIGETIVSSRELTEEEYLKWFDKNEPMAKNWTPERKLSRIHKIDYPDEWEFS